MLASTSLALDGIAVEITMEMQNEYMCGPVPIAYYFQIFY